MEHLKAFLLLVAVFLGVIVADGYLGFSSWLAS
jgi:hypothetical protein